MSDQFVIVGAGFAGAKAVETLREAGHDGPVVLLGAEPDRPYERPPLSKGLLQGEDERDSVFVHEDGWYEEHDVQLRTSTRVAAVHPGALEVELDDGERVPYTRLLLATGAEPRRLDVPGADLDGVVTLRTLADAEALQERVKAASRVVVVGAGWIGCEVAASARALGADVTLLETQATPLAGVFGPEIGAVYREIHADHGVDGRYEVALEAIEGDGKVERIRLDSGDVVDCDLVVAGIGVTPRVALAEGARLPVENGILVDDELRTEAEEIFAAGDVANVLHPFYSERIRVEHWANALEQGPVAARNMLGGREKFAHLPYFFSDQYDVGMEYSGLALTWDRVITRGDVPGREFVAFWMAGDRIQAAMNVNVWDVQDPIRDLIERRVPVTDEQLADPDVALDGLAPEG